MARHYLLQDAPLTLQDVDRTRLQSCSRQEMREWLAARAHQLETELLSVKNLHNSTLTITQIPNELFVEILRLASPYDVTWIATAMGVCRHWRDIIAATPLLWCSFTLLQNARLMKLCLARSKNMPLSMYFRTDEQFLRGLERPGKDLSRVVQLMDSHLSRLIRADLLIDRTESESEPAVGRLVRLLESFLPRLTFLRLVVRAAFGVVPHPLNFHWESLPAIRTIILSGVHIPLDSLQTPHLTRLILSNNRHTERDRENELLSSLLDLLERCVQLREFVFTFEWRFPGGRALVEQVVEASRIVSLPQMGILALTGLCSDIASVMMHLSLPRHTALSLEATDSILSTAGSSSRTPILRAVLPLHSPHSATLDKVHYVTIWQRRDSLQVTAKAAGTYNGDPTLQATFPSDRRSSLLRDAILELGSFLPSSTSLQTLTVNDAIALITSDDWSSVLSAFPQLMYLALHSDKSAVTDDFHLASALEPSPAVVPCQHLRKISLKYTPKTANSSLSMFMSIQEALRKRAEAGSRLPELRVSLRAQGNGISQSSVNDALRSSEAFNELQRNLASVVDTVTIVWKDLAQSTPRIT